MIFKLDPNVLRDTKRIPAIAKHRKMFAKVLRRTRAELSPAHARRLHGAMKAAARRAMESPSNTDIPPHIFGVL